MKRIALSLLLACVLAAAPSSKPKPEAWFPTRDGEQVGPYWRAYDGRTKSNRWSLEIHTAADVQKVVDRGPAFHADPLAPDEFKSVPSDYAGSGFDQGHLAPAADFMLNAEDQAATFSIANAIPQTPDSNQYTVRLLEAAIREDILNGAYDFVVIVTAPAYVASEHKIEVQTIGKNDVWVPTHTAKAVLKKSGDKYDVSAWLIPNDRVKKRPYVETAVSVDAFERATGLDVFQPLEDKLEKKLEAQ